MVEMLIVVAIVGVITSIIVWNYGDFRSGILVTNMAYEAATSIRQAQVFGLGVRGVPQGVGESAEYGGTYGVEFHVGRNAYEVFRDADEDGVCGEGCVCAGGDGECVERVTLLQGTTIARVCGGDVAPGGNVLDHCADRTVLGVTFTRPKPESVIRVGAASYENPPPLAGYAVGAVVLRGGNHCRLVTVYQSGQVSVSGLPDDSCGNG